MKVLLDTNIVIYRESTVSDPNIGTLFYWLDKLHHEKCLDSISIDEVKKYGILEVIKKLMIKIDSYQLLRTRAPLSDEIKKLIDNIDKDENDKNDSILLNELFCNRVDIFITNDKKIHDKAKSLKIDDRVFTVNSFLKRMKKENPDFVDYNVLSIRGERFGNIDIKDIFFDSLKKDYKKFEEWFNRKSEEFAYVCRSHDNKVLAFLYLKKEDEKEDYTDITPPFEKKKRLKIGTLKAELHGINFGERFLKITFDNAMRQNVKEIYVTIFNDGKEEKKRLINMLEEWGFVKWGVKTTTDGEEEVYVKDFTKTVDMKHPKKTFPFISTKGNVFIVPIHPRFHTSLMPDSFLKIESPEEFIDNEPFRLAISKVYVSKSWKRDLSPGDLILFYRTGHDSPSPAYYSSVATAVGVVDSVRTDIKDEIQFKFLCGNRTVLTDEELTRYWNDSFPSNKPFIVNFLYAFPIPLGKRLNLEDLKKLNIIKEAPRGFEKVNKEAFIKFLKETGLDENIIVD